MFVFSSENSTRRPYMHSFFQHGCNGECFITFLNTKVAFNGKFEMGKMNSWQDIVLTFSKQLV